VNPFTRLRGVKTACRILFAAAVVLATAAAMAAPPIATQTMRWLRQEQNGFAGDYLISYSSLSWRNAGWSLRGSVSWLSWQEAGGESTGTSGSGLGSLYVTAGRRIWGGERSWRPRSRGWFRLRGKLPLQDDYSATGSGESDWGASLFMVNRYRKLYVLAEVGILKLGEPQGFDYDGLFNGAVSLSYRRPGARFYPVAGLSASSPAQPGAPAYLELSVGIGAVWSHKVSTSLLYSSGLTSVSPGAGLAAVVSVRLDA